MSVTKTQKSLLLESTEVIYNKKKDAIELISHDPDLKGKHFKITLSRGSETEDVLRQLLVEKDIIPEGILPKFVTLPDDVTVTDPTFPVGVTADGTIKTLNLNLIRNTFIEGGAFTGQTSFLGMLKESIQRSSSYAFSIETMKDLQVAHQMLMIRMRKKRQGKETSRMNPAYILVDANENSPISFMLHNRLDRRLVEILNEGNNVNMHVVYAGEKGILGGYADRFITQAVLCGRGRMKMKSDEGLFNVDVQAFTQKRSRDYTKQS